MECSCPIMGADLQLQQFLYMWITGLNAATTGNGGLHMTLMDDIMLDKTIKVKIIANI